MQESIFNNRKSFHTHSIGFNVGKGVGIAAKALEELRGSY